LSDKVIAIVPAAGLARRLGEDKALVRLGALSAVERIVATCAAAGIVDVRIVRRSSATALPQGLAATCCTADTDSMIDSLRAAIAVDTPPGDASVVVWPVDHPLVGADVVTRLCAARHGGDQIVLPVCAGRPGHPILLVGAPILELLDASTSSLRDVVRRNPDRVNAVEVADSWVFRDIDEPADLRAANGYLEWLGRPATAIMRSHRSRRRYASEEVGERQIEWLVETARHCSTSSFIQSYSAVVVRDPERKNRIAELCGDQDHIRSAPVFIAICADLARIERCCRMHGRSMHVDSLEGFVEATVDASLFGQNLQLAAESEGLGSCMIGAARDHPVALAELLALPKFVYVVFGLTLGWADDDPIPRSRMPLEAILHEETYRSEGLDRHLAAADESMRSWARTTNRARSDGGKAIDERRGWTDRMAWLWGRGAPKGREKLRHELRRLGFGLESAGEHRDRRPE
jgi:nitroreductase/CTP:molybdopterin cytidylyltransferase MocA